MKKYLITSSYMYFDDFAIENVCIVNSREKAEELVQTLKEQISTFKNNFGYVLYLDKDEFKNLNLNITEENIVKDDRLGNAYVFITKDIYDLNSEILEYLYSEKMSYFDFMSFHYVKDSIIKRCCNHYNANLYIEELDYLE